MSSLKMGNKKMKRWTIWRDNGSEFSTAEDSHKS